MFNLDEELSSLDLGIHEARNLAQNRPLCRPRDVFAQRYALLVVHATLGLGMFNRFDGMIRVTDRWTDRRQHIEIAHSLLHFAICSVARHKLVDGFEV